MSPNVPQHGDALAKAHEIARARTRGRYWLQSDSLLVLPGYRIRVFKRRSETLGKINPREDLRFFQMAEHLVDPLIDIAQAVLELGVDHEERCQAQLGRACNCKYRALHTAVERLRKKEIQ